MEPSATISRRRATWLGVIAGVVIGFGVSAVLSGVAIFAGRVWAAFFDSPTSWTEQMENVDRSSWFLLQLINLVSAVLAGWVSAWLSPARSAAAPIILVALALVAALFAQLPATSTPWLVAIWALGAPVGIAIGAAIFRRQERQA